jgi:DNA-binding transcriptional regulator YhcF (GntR family)
MKGTTADADRIRERAAVPDAEGRLPTMAEVAVDLGVSISTVRKALVSVGRQQRATSLAKEQTETAVLFDAIRSSVSENVWPPSQRDLAAATGYTISRVNYLLAVLKHQGLIDLGPNPREIRIVGSSMVIPEVTL